METALNPYVPGAGRQPVALVGRDEDIRRWGVALDRIEAGRDAQPLALYGLRGVGKTVLLNRFARQAQGREWLVARIEARAGASIRQLVAEELQQPLAELARPGVGERVLRALKTALSFRASYDASGQWGFGLDLSGVSGGNAATGDLETDLSTLLRDLTAVAAERGRGVALLIDEAQDVDFEELVAICAIVHRMTQDQAPLTVALAGLPSLPRVLTEAKSYAERLFHYLPIGALGPSEARQALVASAEAEDVAWSGEALELTLAAAEGYPYFLQQFGQEAWEVATTTPITLTDAQLGIARGQRLLDNGFFRARWERATTGEKRYLRAMAVDGSTASNSTDVAERLGKKASSLSLVRAKLINKGLLYAPDHGQVAFTVPGMADFINRQVDS
jgi:hypothetical protein